MARKCFVAELGLEVTFRMNGHGALSLFKLDLFRFDPVIISDQTMPETTGVELAGEILAISADSGYAHHHARASVIWSMLTLPRRQALGLRDEAPRQGGDRKDYQKSARRVELRLRLSIRNR